MSATSSSARRASFTVSAWPGRKFPGDHPARRPRLDDDRQRGHLQDHPQRRQRRPGLAAGHDGDGAHRHRRARQRAAGAQRGAALHAADGERRRRNGEHRLPPDAAPADAEQRSPPEAASSARRRRSGYWDEQAGRRLRSRPASATGARPRSLGGDLKAGMAVITDYQETAKEGDRRQIRRDGEPPDLPAQHHQDLRQRADRISGAGAASTWTSREANSSRSWGRAVPANRRR